VWSALQWKPPHAHNGFLDLALELGIVGIVVFVVGLAAAAWRSAALIRRTSSFYALWPVVYLAFMVMINLAESAILIRNSIFWMLYVVTCMWLIRSRHEGGAA
jgi:exopolysaccharide production protein ExoQ